MQSNGVLENGTTEEIAVNGLGSCVPSGKGHKNGVCEEGEEGVEVGSVSQQLAGEIRPRKMRPRQLSGKDVDIIRLIGQHLREMGFGNTLSSLVDESGCHLEHPKAASFRAHVIAGEWNEANSALDNLVPLLSDSSNVEKMHLLLLQEKYLELLESGHELEALHCLRHELAPVPLHHSDKELQLLTSYMMYSDKDMLRKAAGWPGLGGGAREKLMDKLQGFLPSSVMLPPKRLQQLLTQAVQLQVDRCPFHYLDQDTTEYTLLNDHMCSRANFPCESIHVMSDHSEEVWFVKFSHDGSMLASGSKDGLIIIWNTAGERPIKRHTMKVQGEGIAVMSWSPDDSLLVICGRDDNSDAMIYSVKSGEVKCRVTHSSEDNFVCCAWHRNGTKFYVGGTRGQFLECSVSDGSVTASWEGIRVQSIATHPSSDDVYAADTHYRIRQYNFSEKTSSTLVQEHHSIMSFTLSQNGRQALLNLASQGIHLWDLHDRCLLRRYQGITQNVFAIRSCYGGMRQSFVASGSEDSHIYIWHHRRETPVVILKGHSRSVNCVDWNSVHHSMLASASDDGTVRIWGTEKELKAEVMYQKEQKQWMREQSQQEGDPLLGTSGPSSGSAVGEGSGCIVGGGRENMDIQQSLVAAVSSSDEVTQPRSSELDVIESSASSLSLSSERLSEGVTGIMSLSSRTHPHPVGGSSVVLGTVGGGSTSSGGQAASSWSLPSLSEAASQVHFLSLDFGGSARALASSSTASSVSGGIEGRSGEESRTRTHPSLTQELSMEQDSSQLSQDSSNGSSSQPDELNEEEEEEEEGEEVQERRIPLSFVSDTSLRQFRTEAEPSSAQGIIPIAERPVSSSSSDRVPGSSTATTLSLTGPAPSALTGRISQTGGSSDGSGGADDSSTQVSTSRESNITERHS